MTSQVIRLWQQVLDELSQLSSIAVPDRMDLIDMLQQLRLKPDQPKATWKALIQDMQLPQQLGLLASPLVNDDPYKAGPTLPMAFAETVALLLGQFFKAGIREKGQLEGLWVSAQQQMVDSGLISCLQHLMEATAEQLERCTAAASSAPTADSGAGLAAAAAVAAAGVRVPGPLSKFSGETCLHMVQTAAFKLLEIYVNLHFMLTKAKGMISEVYTKLGSTPAAATHLMVAAMQHISVMLQQHQQQQQQDPNKTLVFLAYFAANSTFLCAESTGRCCKEQGPQALLGRGPHFVVWSDLALVLATYIYIPQQQQHLPGIEGMPGSSPQSGKGTAAAPESGTASSSNTRSSSGDSCGQRQRQRRQSKQGQEDHCVYRALAAWHAVQGQCDHIPASHKALLQLLGVSPQAAVWLAAIPAALEACAPYITRCCWHWNPHNLVAGADCVGEVGRTRELPPALAQELQPQLQQWDNTPYRTLLQLLLLYGAVHAPACDEQCLASCCEFASATKELLQQHLHAADSLAHQHTGPEGDSSRYRPVMSHTVQDELLLLTLQLLHRLQQERQAASTSSSAAAVALAGTAPAGFFSYAAYQIEAVWMRVLLLLTKCDQVGNLRTDSTDLSPAVDAGCGSYSPVSDVFSQQAGAIFGVCESLLRAKGLPDGHIFWGPQDVIRTAICVAESCYYDLNNQPQPLLWLAEGATAQQQVGFFHLLLTLFKLSVTPQLSGATIADSHCRGVVATCAAHMLQHIFNAIAGSDAAAATACVSGACSSSGGGGGSSSSSNCGATAVSGNSPSVALWLLLLGRCFLQWAAELEQLQAEGADWEQIIKGLAELQQSGGLSPTSLGLACLQLPALPTLSICLVNCVGSDQPLPLKFACAVMTLSQSEEGSSILASLAATGCDVDAVMQGCEAIAACYPDVQMLEGHGDAAADRVAGLIAALEAVGKACSVLAVPDCCNNPACDNLAGASELVLVSGKGCICAGCKVARYCGKVCQQSHWKQHKPVCKMLRAAASATTR